MATAAPDRTLTTATGSATLLFSSPGPEPPRRHYLHRWTGKSSHGSPRSAFDYLPVAKVDARVLDRFYAALRKAGNARTGGGKLSASRIRDVHAILSGALGLAAR
jgi:hypothetical protein